MLINQYAIYRVDLNKKGSQLKHMPYQEVRIKKLPIRVDSYKQIHLDKMDPTDTAMSIFNRTRVFTEVSDVLVVYKEGELSCYYVDEERPWRITGFIQLNPTGAVISMDTKDYEMVGVVESVGAEVTNVKPGDRVTVNVETFCGECFFCQQGYVNNCTDQNGGWALGCRIDGGQTEYVRVPYADQGLDKIPDTVTDEQALFVGDVLATGFWAARISEITQEDTVLIIGAGPTGICTLLCVMLKHPKKIIICEKDETRREFVKKYHPEVMLVEPEDAEAFVKAESDHGGADVVLEVAGAKDTFELAWKCARPNAVVTVVALYDEAQILPLPNMYGKNLTFKTGGVDGCDCKEILKLIEQGKIDTTPLITHRFELKEIEKAYEIFEKKLENVIKIAIYNR